MVDFLIVGSGLAGLVAALELAKHGEVTILCKGSANETNTNLAQGGICAVLDPDDSFEKHEQDTLVAGAGLCNPEAVKLLVKEAPAAVNYLQKLGVNFTALPEGKPDLHLEGGHSNPRILHVRDYTGKSLQETLLEQVKKNPHIELLEHQVAIDLRISDDGGNKRCTGVSVLNVESGTVKNYSAMAVFLATGGLGQVYQHTTNSSLATGDGIAMAYRAGAEISGLEFIQFHPTALFSPGFKGTFLISEAVRGAGAVLHNYKGEDFIKNLHPLGSLAPRDVVARAIAAEMSSSGKPCVFLDISGIPLVQFQQHFPSIFKNCIARGIDLRKGRIPVVPAAHYACGGINTDVYGQTSVPNLYAVGEAANTGVHGANRLASNSLLEAVVFAKRAAQSALQFSDKMTKEYSEPFIISEPAKPNNHPATYQFLKDRKKELQQKMWQQAGIVRKPHELADCYKWLYNLESELAKGNFSFLTPPYLELRNLVQVSLLIVEAALNRKESCGGHFIVHDGVNGPAFKGSVVWEKAEVTG